MTARIRWLLGATVAIVGAATVAVAVAPELSFAYRGPSAHIAIETSATLVSLLAAFILLGRVAQAASRGELLLLIGLIVLFVGNLARLLAPSYTGEDDAAVVWVPLSANLIASGVLVWSALASEGGAVPRRPLRLAGAVLGGAALAMLAVQLLSGELATGIDPGVSPRDSDAVLVTGAPGLLATQLVSMALFAAAAFGFARRAERGGDELLAWLAIGMAFAALARLNYFLYPSIYSEWVFTGDLLRFATYVVILIGALRQIAAYQRAAAAAAVVEERSRIASDLHDGLAQDLAFIAMQSERMADDDPRASELADAARNALAVSRGAIENLRLTDAPLAPALASVAKALTGRHRARLSLDLDHGLEATPQVRDQLLRIASEAISNALRHGDPDTVSVRLLADGSRIRLAVSDDGSGIVPASAEGDAGLGIPGMRRRVERLGGSFKLRSREGGGTTVEILVP